MTSRFGRAVIVAALALCLSSCATTAFRPEQLAPFQEPADRELTGRMSVHYRDLASQREDALTGNFQWAQHGKTIDLALLDPLGQTVALVHSGLEGASVTLRNGQRYEGTTPEELTLEMLGWTVPVRGLTAWLNGEPANSDMSGPIREEPDGTRHFKEDGWSVTYPGNVASRSPRAPRRIDLAYPGPGVAVDLRLIVDQRNEP